MANAGTEHVIHSTGLYLSCQLTFQYGNQRALFWLDIIFVASPFYPGGRFLVDGCYC